MTIKKSLKPFIPSFMLKLYSTCLANKKYESNIERFAFDKQLDVRTDIQKKYHYDGDLLDIFIKNKSLTVHKWHHYIPLYERYFSPFRGNKVKFLEIGVGNGGSLQMWRKYFGQDAIIFGIDINPQCEKYNGLAGQVRIGSQADKIFLAEIVKEMGGVDIVLDDGSHQMDHVSASLKHLFPQMSYGGIYMIEDLQTAYWKEYGGGYRLKGSFFSLVMGFVDDMHHWYHKKAVKYPDISSECSGIHIHDALVVLEKNKIYPPVHSRIA
jgi:hypothetical protein